LGRRQFYKRSIIAVVQRFGREVSKVYTEIGSSKTERGFVSLTRQGDEVFINNRQISSIRYIPAKRYTDPYSAETKWKSECYRGIVRLDREGHAEFETLDKEWVEENFADDFLALLKSLRSENHAGYIPIPEGANEPHEQESIVFRENAPEVRYYKSSEINADRRCVLDSAASAFIFLNKRHLAHHLRTSKNDKTKELNPMEYFFHVVKKNMTTADNREFEVLKLKTSLLKSWDTLSSPKDYIMCVLGIRSDDGKSDHAISIVKDWIFDTNFEKALPLTIDSLNLCSSSSERDCKFVCVTTGYLLKHKAEIETK
jgi:hypothetical protein